MGECHVYRIFDAAGTLLYVGCSHYVPARLSSHRRKAWGAEIATVQVQTFRSRDKALAAEKAAIRSEKPVHNVASVGGVPPELARRLRAATKRCKASDAKIAVLVAERDRQIVRAVTAGWTLRKVAGHVGLSHVSVRDIVRRAQAGE